MASSSHPIARRAAIKAAGVATCAIAMQGLGALASRRASAQVYGQTPRNVVRYQDTPKDGHDCKGCQQFIPGPSADADGHCKVVAGTVSPNGWCLIWTAKA